MSESRAEPRASRKLALGAGLIATLMLLGLLLQRARAPDPTNVPLGIAGAKLGSRLSDVRGALPNLVPSGESSGETPTYRTRTSVFDERASCSLEFAIAATLSRIECVVELPASRDASAKVRARLLATLRGLYGKESEAGGGTWLWQNARARLRLRESADAVPTLQLSNWLRSPE
ncbi:MAG: hypothetical protein IPI67_30795 [Myxococcales bacterium]|nr:hypothetical protein [Myxococcales bacterium]